MLGAVDSMIERESEEEEPSPVLASWRAAQAILQKVGVGAQLSGMPFEQAIKMFEERKILPKPLFDQLRDAAKKKAFTVAGLAQEELLVAAHGELARQIKESKDKTYYDTATGKWVYKGPNLREFDKFAKDRLEKAGWTPANPSHVETIFRTNTMSAYGSGRIVETTQPAVVAARPYWQIVAVGDSRSRPAHKKAHGTILSVDHPFWRKAYPPFGFGCRCRVVSRSKRWVDKHGGPTIVPMNLPDEGFASGIDASLVPQPLDVPSEGQRQPAPGKSPHQIDRLKPTPIVKPLAPMPTVSDKPPELPKAPIAPIPIAAPQVGAVEGRHIGELFAAKGVTKAAVQHVAASFAADELAVLEAHPVKRITLRNVLIGGKGRPLAGSYGWTDNGVIDEISVATEREKGTFGLRFTPGRSKTFSATRPTENEAISATVHHEFGHRLHVRATKAIDQMVRQAFITGNPITKYAASTAREYFAESYAVYRTDPAALLKHDPIGHKMVRDVLDFWGMPHG